MTPTKEQLEEILADYIQPNSLIDSGNLYFAATEFRRQLKAEKEKSRKLLAIIEVQQRALEKISDPRKRDHREPDSYTELACVMSIADEALAEVEKLVVGE